MKKIKTYPLTKEQIMDSLNNVFGFSEFRENQETIIHAILQGHDLFASMPTGGGKSLCYQLPAYLFEGACIVVSPLISLMKDQVDAAKSTGLRAAYINSTMTAYEINAVYESLQDKELDIVYAAPERFASATFTAMLKSAAISMFAIDEAHCISEWGHDFRPDYLLLSNIREQFPDIPVTAFTASATVEVQQDIIQKLRLRDPVEIRASFNRINLFYHVIKKSGVQQQILDFIKEHPNEQGIVYRTTRQDVEDTCEYLTRAGIKALPYHAGLENDQRKKNQESFNRDEVDIVVATIAFGMGIDKSNIRFVVHGDIPKNIEGYYQETGRSGRDGGPAQCVLFYGWSDIHKIRYFINEITDTAQKETAEKKLNDMIKYASTNTCRRRYILEYFGEKYEDDNCGTCDTCTGASESVEATIDAQIVLSAIARTSGHFGAGHIVDIVCGANTERIRRLGHDRIKTYGKGKDRNKKYWRSVIDELLSQQYLVISGDAYPTLAMAPAGIDILKGNKTFHIIKKDDLLSNDKISSKESNYNEELFQQLRQVRKTIADEKGVPPFVIFSDMSLKEMCIFYPVNEEDFLLVNGVGRVKLRDYGTPFINTIQLFLKKNPETVPARKNRNLQGRNKKSSNKTSSTLEETMRLITEGLTYTEIADKRKLTASTIAGHIEQLIMQNHDIDISSHVQSEKYTFIENIFMKLKTSGLRDVVEACEGMANYEEARLVRAHMQRPDFHRSSSDDK